MRAQQVELIGKLLLYDKHLSVNRNEAVAAVDPAQLLEPLQERREARLPFRIIRGRGHEHPDAPHPPVLLRTRQERPRGSRAAEQRYELAPPNHSITSSALACSVSGTVRPRPLAVLRLIANSNVVGCNTGSSDGLAPLRIRPA